jgi:peptidoglycan-associated lipoprotein
MKIKNVWLVLLVMAVAGAALTTTSCSKKKELPMIPAETSQIVDQDSAQEASEAEALEQQRIREQEIERISRQEAEMKQQEAVRKQFVSENVYFDFDDASLSQQARQVLTEKAAWLRANRDVSVTIEGHCDERGTAEYNVALGQRRAQSIKTFLVNAGIDASRLRTVSFGEERPLDPGKTEDAYARNRRGQFRFDN